MLSEIARVDDLEDHHVVACGGCLEGDGRDAPSPAALREAFNQRKKSIEVDAVYFIPEVLAAVANYGTIRG